MMLANPGPATMKLNFHFWLLIAFMPINFSFAEAQQPTQLPRIAPERHLAFRKHGRH